MANDQNGAGPEQTESEPRQGVGEAWSEKRPVDWEPPPGNPGSDQDGQVDRDGSARSKDEQAPADDDGPIEEEMKDVEANNSVSAEHPQPR